MAPSKQESTTYEPSLVCKLLILGCRLLIPDRLLVDPVRMKIRLLIALVVIVAAAVSMPVTALAQNPVIGRWDGAIQLQRSEMTVSLTIEPDGDGGWRGSIEIPARRAEPLPLGNIFVDGEFVSFSVEGTSGDPAFAGAISGGRRFAGQFSEGDVTFPFQLTRRTGVPDYMFVVPSTDGAALEGTWHGRTGHTSRSDPVRTSS